MKKIILTLTLFFTFNLTFSQNYYRATFTELYKKNTYTGKWELADQNKNVSIDVISEENTISIHAKSPTLYKIFTGSEESVDTEKFYGKTYNGVELKNDVKCRINILVHKETKYIVISIVYSDYNVRYFVEPKDGD
jgi:hypothetical protein